MDHIAQPATWRIYDSKLTPYEIKEGDGDPITCYWHVLHIDK